MPLIPKKIINNVLYKDNSYVVGYKFFQNVSKYLTFDIHNKTYSYTKLDNFIDLETCLKFTIYCLNFNPPFFKYYYDLSIQKIKLKTNNDKDSYSNQQSIDKNYDVFTKLNLTDKINLLRINFLALKQKDKYDNFNLKFDIDSEIYSFYINKEKTKKMEIKIILFYNKSHKVKTNLVAIKKTLHLKKRYMDSKKM